MDYWGGPKGMLAPPLKLLGGGPGPPWPPLFLRLCWMTGIGEEGDLKFVQMFKTDEVKMDSF